MSDATSPLKKVRRIPTAASYVLGVLVGLFVLTVLFHRRGEFLSALRQLGHCNVSWALAALAVEVLSVLGYAILQRYVLGLAGDRVALTGMFVLSLANIAIAYTIPGEPAVSSAYRYRYVRRRGASAAGAAWSILTIIIAQSIAMSLLLVVAALLSLAGTTATSDVGVVSVGLVIVVGSSLVLVRQDLVVRMLERLLRAMRRWTGRPRDEVVARLESTLATMRAMPLGAFAIVRIVALAGGVWLLDFVCLVTCFASVHARIPWGGVLLAYGVAQIVASLPFVPGGIGIVEGSLAVILVAYGTRRVDALAVVLFYRLLTFWLAVTVGWISVGAIEWSRRRASADIVAPSGATSPP